jgi:hypothetical protein
MAADGPEPWAPLTHQTPIDARSRYGQRFALFRRTSPPPPFTSPGKHLLVASSTFFNVDIRVNLKPACSYFAMDTKPGPGRSFAYNRTPGNMRSSCDRRLRISTRGWIMEPPLQRLGRIRSLRSALRDKYAPAISSIRLTRANEPQLSRPCLVLLKYMSTNKLTLAVYRSIYENATELHRATASPTRYDYLTTILLLRSSSLFYRTRINLGSSSYDRTP